MEHEVPFDVWRQIFIRVDEETLASCSIACLTFHRVLNEDSFWVQRSQYYGSVDVLPPLKWRHAAAVGEFPGNEENSVDTSSFKFNYRDLVLSGKGFKETRLFEIEPGRRIEEQSNESFRYTQGGNGIETQENDNGCNPDPSVQNCYALSFGLSVIYVSINFAKWGISDWILDHVRPLIRISVKINHRYDCGAEVFLGAELNYRRNQIKHNPRNEERDTVNEKRYKRVCRRWEQWTEANWEDLSIELDDYPSGMRNMMVMISGKDTQFWAGFFGPKIANCDVEVVMPTSVILKSLEEDKERNDADNENDAENDREDGSLLGNIRRMLPIFRGQRWNPRHLGQQVFPP